MFRLSFKLVFLIAVIFSATAIQAQNTEKPQQNLEIIEHNLHGCIQTIFTKQFVITTEADFLKAVRDDASRDYCLKKIDKIDFTEKSLLGITINSGYCRRPSGLKYQAIKDKDEKKIILNISYTDPQGSVCRALSRYDLWVLVPKIPEDFEVVFEVASVLPEKK